MASSSNEADFQDDDLEDQDFNLNRDSDEDTEDASETEDKKDEEFTGIKDQVYRDQLHQYKRQLQQLKEGTYAPYIKRLKKLEQMHNDRLLMNEIYVKNELQLIEEDYEKEKELALQEFEERKQELKENLIKELEHKKKMMESERQTMELTGDNSSAKPVTTRKLRRRPNEPLPAPEKRSKPSPVQLSNALYEQDVNEDLSKLAKLKSSSASSSNNSSHQNSDAYIEDSRLCLDKRWYIRDQQVSVDAKEFGRFAAIITSIGHEEVTLKKTSDNSKFKVTLQQFQRGLYSFKKRS